MNTRRVRFVVALLGSQLSASLVSFRATAETPVPTVAPAEIVGVRPRAPIVMKAASPRVDVASLMARPVLPGVAPIRAAPARVNPLSAAHGAAAVQQVKKDTTSPQLAQRRLIGWIAGSVGLAGIGLGATTSVMALSKSPPADRQCADPIRICSPDGKALSGSSSLSTLSAAGWAIGAIGIATGTVLILTSNKKTGQETALGPDIYKRGGGLSVRRSF
ncbi:MAG TPA: hypothetical protein VHC69_25725 [Polyangiaceae bacterium]|nr:hypothetical protein [Polyangiaceae bacterium]